MENTEMPFPESIKDFAKELGELCRKHQLDKFTGTYRPGFFSDDTHGWGLFQFVFEDGRHGESSGKIQLLSERRLNIKLDIN